MDGPIIKVLLFSGQYIFSMKFGYIGGHLPPTLWKVVLGGGVTYFTFYGKILLAAAFSA